MPVKLLACAALLVGCAHQRPLNEAFFAMEPGRWVTVQTTSGATLAAYSVPTSTGIGYQGEDGYMIDPAVIARVTDERTARGAGEGFLIGAAGGALIGAALGYAEGDDPPCDDWCLFNMTAGDKAVLGGLVLGMLGSVVGLAAGAIKGSEDVYETPSGIAITPGGPSGSVAGMTVTF